MFQVFFSIDISVMRNYDAYLFLDDGDGILALGRKDCKIFTKRRMLLWWSLQLKHITQR
jgi:hypothetical protein